MQEPFVRVTSTANRMGRAWFARLFRVFLLFDLLALALGAFSYCSRQEQIILQAESTTDMQAAYENAERKLDLPNLAYFFRADKGEWHEVRLVNYLKEIRPIIYPVLALELIELILQGRWGARKARRLLRPLNRMAEAAQELSRMQAEPQRSADSGEKLQDLEEAIERIAPGDRLRTGDIELEGLENAINSMLGRMQESYRQQARFVSDASHELRTPISVIQGYAGMLRRWGKEDPKVLEEGIEAIASESDYMKKLVDQLLFLARGDSGRNRLEMQSVHIVQIVQDARDDAALIDEQHTWELGKCEDAIVTADPDMLKQCVRILTDNAARYTPKGGTIRLQATHNSAEAHIEVQDTGCGIGSEDIRHIFDRFYRADAARSRESGGSGLGLSIARWIVDNHGGHFEVLSREGLGTRFSICLPLADAASASPASSHANPR